MAEMHALGYSPTIKKRALSRRLRELRGQCGLTTSEACKRLDWSPSKLNYVEHAKWLDPNTDTVADLCELYGVEGRDRDALLHLTREARQRGWWRRREFNDVFSNELPGFEAGASKISTFENTLVPGLLQTPGYSTLLAQLEIDDEDMIGRRTAARAERQKILTRQEEPAHLHALLDEAALLHITDPEVWDGQIRHLIAMNERSNISVQILRTGDGLYPGIGLEVFAILDFPEDDDRSIVYLETTIDDRMLEERDEIESYRLRFDRLRSAALAPDATSAYLRGQIE